MVARPRVNEALAVPGTATIPTTEEETTALVPACLAAAREAHAAEGILPPRRRGIGKRVFDLILCIPAIIVTLPLSLLIALAIKLDSPGPVLFRQMRIGKDGRSFVMYKFRSMWQSSPDAVDIMHQQAVDKWMAGVPLLHEEHAREAVEQPSARPPSHSHFKIQRDPRVTRVGRFLRKTSLDELPQLLNVFLGTMSIVGPRPSIQYEVDRYSQRDLARLYVKPGITGLWQVEGRGRTSFHEMVEMDLDYALHHSLLRDISLILRTVPAVLIGRGAA